MCSDQVFLDYPVPLLGLTITNFRPLCAHLADATA
jgi:hypothetical protein